MKRIIFYLSIIIVVAFISSNIIMCQRHNEEQKSAKYQLPKSFSDAPNSFTIPQGTLMSAKKGKGKTDATLATPVQIPASQCSENAACWNYYTITGTDTVFFNNDLTLLLWVTPDPVIPGSFITNYAQRVANGNSTPIYIYIGWNDINGDGIIDAGETNTPVTANSYSITVRDTTITAMIYGTKVDGSHYYSLPFTLKIQ